MWDKYKVETFLKLTGARVSAPVPEHMDYYLARLGQMADHARIEDKARQFLEDWDRFGDLNPIKSQMIEALIHCLRGTLAYSELNDNPGLLVEKKAKTKKIGAVNGKTIVSIDMAAANYTVFRVLDPSLPDSWLDFVYEVCSSQNTLCPDSLASSKKLRQIVFGNLNPKRTQKLQAVYMRKLAEHIRLNIEFGGEVSLRSPDEINIVAPVLQSDDVDGINSILEEFTFTHDQPCYNNLNWSAVRLKTEILKAEAIPNISGAYVLSVIGPAGEVIGRKLFGVPRNIYMLTLANTLGGIITDRDRLFSLDGRLALWYDR